MFIDQFALNQSRDATPVAADRPLRHMESKDKLSVNERAEKEFQKAVNAGYEVRSYGSPYFFGKGPRQI